MLEHVHEQVLDRIPLSEATRGQLPCSRRRSSPQKPENPKYLPELKTSWTAAAGAPSPLRPLQLRRGPKPMFVRGFFFCFFFFREFSFTWQRHRRPAFLDCTLLLHSSCKLSGNMRRIPGDKPQPGRTARLERSRAHARRAVVKAPVLVSIQESGRTSGEGLRAGGGSVAVPALLFPPSQSSP